MAGPALTLVVCAAPLAERAAEVAAALQQGSWTVTVAATPAALDWLDTTAIEDVTGSALVSEYRQPGTSKRGRAAAVVVCPTTFNTLNKLATGISDNYATGIVNEALAAGTPVLAVPMISDRLWPHPALAGHVDSLTAAGVKLVDARTGRLGARPVASGTGEDVARAFDPSWLLPHLGRVEAA